MSNQIQRFCIACGNQARLRWPVGDHPVLCSQSCGAWAFINAVATPGPRIRGYCRDCGKLAQECSLWTHHATTATRIAHLQQPSTTTGDKTP
jgi:hypothetical protein